MQTPMKDRGQKVEQIEGAHRCSAAWTGDSSSSCTGHRYREMSRTCGGDAHRSSPSLSSHFRHFPCWKSSCDVQEHSVSGLGAGRQRCDSCETHIWQVLGGTRGAAALLTPCRKEMNVGIWFPHLVDAHADLGIDVYGLQKIICPLIQHNGYQPAQVQELSVLQTGKSRWLQCPCGDSPSTMSINLHMRISRLYAELGGLLARSLSCEEIRRCSLICASRARSLHCRLMLSRHTATDRRKKQSRAL